jgi:hypothetical protein
MKDDRNGFEPPTAEELAEAVLLRERLESGAGDPGPGAGRMLALFAAASEAVPIDDVAARRIRRELVAAASRRTLRPALRPALRTALQVAAAVLVAALLAAGRASTPPSAALLAAREVEARDAVARVLFSSGARSDGSGRLPASTLASLVRVRNAELFSNVESDRLSWRVGLSSAGADRTDGLAGLPGVPVAPTPGGAF